MESWYGIPLIARVIKHYKVRLIARTGESLIIEHEGTWYSIGDNGGEINVWKINDQEYHRAFPTVYLSESLNADTLMYRLFQVLNDEPIDYEYRQEPLNL